MADDDSRGADSITSVAARVIDDARELLREELALVRAEMRQEASDFIHSVIDMGAAAGFAAFAALFVLLGLAQGAALWWGIRTWVAYILMGIVLGIASGIALLMSRARLRQLMVPPKTAQSLRETKEWINRRMTSDER